METIIRKSATGHDLPAIITPDGKVRLLARPAALVPHHRSAMAADPTTLLPESQWVEFDRTRDEIQLLDQGNVGECTGEGLVNTVMVTRAVANQEFHLLSGSSVYAQVNRNVDQGASLTDAVAASQTFGAALQSEVPEGFYTAAQLARKFPTAAATAKRFVTPSGSWVTFHSFAEAGSLAQDGYQIYISVTAGGGWDVSRFSSAGVPPFLSGYGNHAQSGGEAMKRVNNTWLLKVRNSWGLRWGLGGFYWIDARFIDNQRAFEGYALKFTSQDPMDPNRGPIVA